VTRSVAVLKGGWSKEREISLMGSDRICKALSSAGYTVTEIDVNQDLGVLLTALTPPPDVVYNALHGTYGEDGCIQGVLKCLGIPFSHSGVLASAIAMHKPMAKKLFQSVNIPCPKHKVVTRASFEAGDRLDFPYVMKPLNEGSSLGVIIVRKESDLSDLDKKIWSYGDQIMVEKLIHGRELTVSVMGNKALGVTEIRPSKKFYDYKAKYTPDGAEHIIPAPIHKKAYTTAMEYALRAHEILGCRGVSRADLMYDDRDGEPGNLYLLEVNTQPGMTPFSLVPEQAAYAGIEFDDLVCWMVENATCD